jgi:MFS family permease
MIPLSLFGDRVIATASAAGALMGAVMMGALTYLPLHVQAVLHGSPTAAGTAVAPMLVGWPLASAVAGRLLPRVGYRVLVRTGLLTLGRSTAALWRLLVEGAGTSAMRAVMFFLGGGMGLANTPVIVIVQERAARAARGG